MNLFPTYVRTAGETEHQYYIFSNTDMLLPLLISVYVNASASTTFASLLRAKVTVNVLHNNGEQLAQAATPCL